MSSKIKTNSSETLYFTFHANATKKLELVCCSKKEDLNKFVRLRAFIKSLPEKCFQTEPVKTKKEDEWPEWAQALKESRTVKKTASSPDLSRDVPEPDWVKAIRASKHESSITSQPVISKEDDDEDDVDPFTMFEVLN